MKSSLAPKSSKPATRSTATPVQNMITQGSTLTFSFTVKNGASCSVAVSATFSQHQSVWMCTASLSYIPCAGSACPLAPQTQHEQCGLTLYTNPSPCNDDGLLLDWQLSYRDSLAQRTVPTNGEDWVST